MDWKRYFEETEGTGVLATADANGRVDVAVYARPHVKDDQTIEFIMADKLSHANLQSNPHAAYLFHEAAEGYPGYRLSLTKTDETLDPDRVQQLRRQGVPSSYDPAKGQDRYVVTFHVDRVRPLVGDDV